MIIAGELLGKFKTIIKYNSALKTEVTIDKTYQQDTFCTTRFKPVIDYQWFAQGSTFLILTYEISIKFDINLKYFNKLHCLYLRNLQ